MSREGKGFSYDVCVIVYYRTVQEDEEGQLKTFWRGS